MLRYKQKQRCHYRVFFLNRFKGRRVKACTTRFGIKASAFHDPNCSQALEVFLRNKGNSRKKTKKRWFQNKTLQSKQTHNDAASVVFTDVFIQCNKRRRRKKKEKKKHPAGELTVIVAHV